MSGQAQAVLLLGHSIARGAAAEFSARLPLPSSSATYLLDTLFCQSTNPLECVIRHTALVW